MPMIHATIRIMPTSSNPRRTMTSFGLSRLRLPGENGRHDCDRQPTHRHFCRFYGRVPNLDPGPPADVFVIGALVGILEAAPPTDVINENSHEASTAAFNI